SDPPPTETTRGGLPLRRLRDSCRIGPEILRVHARQIGIDPVTRLDRALEPLRQAETWRARAPRFQSRRCAPISNCLVTFYPTHFSKLFSMSAIGTPLVSILIMKSMCLM